jgi:hypothetical protein
LVEYNMDIVKIKSPKSGWGDVNTKYSKTEIEQNEFSEGTYNVTTSEKGTLKKRPGSVLYSTLSTAAKDQFEVIFSDGARHLLTVDSGNLYYSTGNGVENLALAGLSTVGNNEFMTYQDRVYFANGITTKVYDKITSYGDVPYTFPDDTIKDMGCQVPSSSATAADAASGSDIAAGAYRYKITYLYYGYEESNGSVASNTVTLASPSTISLTNIPIGGYGVTARKIYRATGDFTEYTLITTISDNTTAVYTDTSSEGTLPLPDDNNAPPLFSLITNYLDHAFVAGVAGDPFTLYFSLATSPDIFPENNNIPCNQEDTITALVVYLDRLVVFNRRSMGQIVGSTSDTFRYASINSSVGCVDTRSIQIRVIDGVPKLTWLAEKGIWSYDGNSFKYLSDSIENLVNSDIQQAFTQNGRTTDSDQDDFESGTPTDGINTDADPGAITTKGPYWDTDEHPAATIEEQTNPKRSWDSKSDFTADVTTHTNTATEREGTTYISAPTRFIPVANEGTVLSGTFEDSTAFPLTIPLADNFTGFSETNQYWNFASTVYTGVAYATDTFERAGTLDTVSLKFGWATAGSTAITYKVKVWADLAGSPGSELYASDNIVAFGSPGANDITVTSHNVGGIAISAGIKVWIGIHVVAIGAILIRTVLKTGKVQKVYSSLGWDAIVYTSLSAASATEGFTFTQTAVGAGATWQSAIYDSKTDDRAITEAITFLSPYNDFPSGTAILAVVEGSSSPTFFGGAEIVQNINNPGGFGSTTLTLQDKRYWRLKLYLTTDDDRVTPQFSQPVISFLDTATWISEPIDCSGDITAYEDFTVTSNAPAGTTVTTTVRTADTEDGLTEESWVAFGAVVVKQWFQVKIEVTAYEDSTASVSAIALSWTLSSTFISRPLDTGSTPSGWGLFQADFDEGITDAITFYMRSAATEDGLSAAIWYEVTSGEFPTTSLPVLQWVQWKAEIDTEPDGVSTIDSVSISWFITTPGTGVRCASIFWNQEYILAVSEYGNSYNNLLIVIDDENKIRIYRDMNISTMSYFFNEPYACDAVTFKVFKMLEGLQDRGEDISFDLRTKAYDFSTQYVLNDSRIKILRNIMITVANTGATYTVEYSPDEGTNFYSLYDTSGNASWTVAENNLKTIKFLKPDFSSAVPSGYSILLKITNTDSKEVEIVGWEMDAMVRKQPPIITG